jgi:hypothetical protein
MDDRNSIWNKFDEAYFERLRDRTVAAGERGIDVMVTLFQGWSHWVQKKIGKNPWCGSVFHKSNNINGIDGDRGQDAVSLIAIKCPALSTGHASVLATLSARGQMQPAAMFSMAWASLRVLQPLVENPLVCCRVVESMACQNGWANVSGAENVVGLVQHEMQAASKNLPSLDWPVLKLWWSGNRSYSMPPAAMTLPADRFRFAGRVRRRSPVVALN